MPTKELNKNNNDELQQELDAIRSVLAGNTYAFQLLQKKYQKTISSLIRKMIRNEDDVDDLTQETFIKAFNALPSFKFNYNFSSWIYKIASNTCIDFLRKKRFKTISLDQPIGDPEDENFLEIEDNSYIPDINVLSDERRQALIDAIESLPESYRIIIKLRHEEELDYNEISIKMNIPLGTVKAHLFRARKILYDSLKKHLYLFS